MAKRLIDTNLFRKGLIRGLNTPYKLLWIYIFLDCDHAGVWLKDFEIAKIYLKIDINEEEALSCFGNKIVIIDDEKWFIPSFIDFQYGELNENNRVHNSVINILRKYKLYNNKGLINPLQGIKDKDKEKDKGKDKEKVPEYEDFKNYVLEIEPRIDISDLKIKYEAWKVNDWKDGKNQKIKNWKSKILQTIPHLKKNNESKQNINEKWNR